MRQYFFWFLLSLVALTFVGCVNNISESDFKKSLELSEQGDTEAMDAVISYYNVMGMENDARYWRYQQDTDQ